MSSSSWKSSALGELLNFRRGHDLPKTKMKEGPVPVVGSSGIIGFHNEFTTKNPCLTIGRSGNIGNPHILEEDCWAHNTTLYVDDFKGNEPKYLFYLLKTLGLSNYGGGSAVPTLNRNHIHPIGVRYTSSRDEQKNIAHVLSTLDEKIEVNNQISKTLENMAQAIYKHWFVDFEFPDENGNPYKSSGGKMVESEFWRIPEFWEIVSLETFVEIKYGKDHKKLAEGEYPVYGSGGIMRYVDKFLYNGESVLVPRKGTLNNVMYINESFWSVDTMFYTVMKKSNIAKFIYLFLNGIDLKSMNVGSAVPSMTTNILNNMKIIKPPSRILEEFNSLISPIFQMIKHNKEENDTLVEIRDELLPKLLSGEIELRGILDGR